MVRYPLDCCHLRRNPRFSFPNSSRSLSGEWVSLFLFVEFLSVPSITHLCVSPRPDIQPESEQTSALLALVQQYGHQLVDVAFNYQMVDSKTLLLVLQKIPNVEFLELSTFDHSIVLGDGFTLLDSTIAKLVTGRNLEMEDDGAKTPLCPKMKKFRCNLHEATSEVKKDLIDLVQSRRGGKVDKGCASWLEEVSVIMNVGSVEGMIAELKARGVRTSFVEFSIWHG
ncbi:hypothetical protein NMY22_g19815 [Coprinellus aureogranulatus]|nr:hypothetical protein NMY22_g19815 [Coprinellus aureogranulatus]